MKITDDLATPLEPKNRRKTGHKIEGAAATWLSQQGIEIIFQNYHCQRGEIDLIGWEGDILVFFEVRYRHETHLVSPEESVTRKKQNRIIRTAQHYLQYAWQKPMPMCRLDVVAVYNNGLDLSYNWIRNAFTL